MKTHFYYYQFFMQPARNCFINNLNYYKNMKPYWGRELIYEDNKVFIVKAVAEDKGRTDIKYIIGYLDNEKNINNYIYNVFLQQIPMRERDRDNFKTNITVELSDLGLIKQKENITKYFSMIYEFSPMFKNREDY